MFEGKNVLIAGAGDGEMLPTLVEEGVTVRGFDISPLYTNARIAYGDIMNPNIMQEMEMKFNMSFDLVITENLLEVLDKPEIAIDNVRCHDRMHITRDETLMELDSGAFWVIDK